VVTDPPPFSLPWTEDFESIGSTTTFTANTTDISGLPEWSYEKTEYGRLRFEAGANFNHGGDHAATLDADPSGVTSINYLILTLNLSSYASYDLLLSFYFMHHGEENNTNDRVWIRGNISASWIEVINLNSIMGTAGTWNYVSGIDLDSILTNNGQSVSTSFQIRFGQEDNFPATSTTGSDGFTFDDITLETEGIPYDLLLQDITVDTGQTEVYQARNSITAAGDTTYFIVEGYDTPGGDATFEAGNNILLDGGFHAKDGSKFMAKIDTSLVDGKAKAKAETEVEDWENVGGEQIKIWVVGGGVFRVCLDMGKEEYAAIKVFDSNGDLVYNNERAGVETDVDLSAYAGGVYTVKVWWGDKLFIEEVTIISE